MHLSSVLLPEPFSPMRPNVEPFGTSNETSFSAQNSSYLARRPRRTAALSDWLRSVEPEALGHVLDDDRGSDTPTAPESAVSGSPARPWRSAAVDHPAICPCGPALPSGPTSSRSDAVRRSARPGPLDPPAPRPREHTRQRRLNDPPEGGGERGGPHGPLGRLQGGDVVLQGATPPVAGRALPRPWSGHCGPSYAASASTRAASTAPSARFEGSDHRPPGRRAAAARCVPARPPAGRARALARRLASPAPSGAARTTNWYVVASMSSSSSATSSGRKSSRTSCCSVLNSGARVRRRSIRVKPASARKLHERVPR